MVALDRRDALAPDQVAALEVLEQLGQAVADLGHALEAALPEHLALHGGVHQHRSLRSGQSVQARRDDPADRRRQGAGLGRGLPGCRSELLDEERVPLRGGGEQRRPLLTVVEPQLLEQQLGELAPLLLARAAGAAAPCTTGARRPTTGEHRAAPAARARARGSGRRAAARPASRRGRAGWGRPSGGPRTRARSAARLRPPPGSRGSRSRASPGPERTRPGRARARSRGGGRRSATPSPTAASAALPSFASATLERVALEDPGELLQLCRERAVGAAVAVRQRPAVDGAAAELGGDHGELDREPRLPDAGLAEHRDEMRAAFLDRPLPDPAQRLELACTPDQRNHRQTPLPGR